MIWENKKWFTFIEIMVVIAVFSIWVFAVLRLLSSNLVNMESIKTKNSAVFLAKESMDIVHNIKNSNLYKWLKRDCVLVDKIDTNLGEFGNVDNVCKYLFSSGVSDSKNFKVWINPGWYFSVSQFDDDTFEKNFVNSEIFYYTWTIAWKKIARYAYSGLDYPATKTKFARYIKFKVIKEYDKELPTAKIVKIESHVLFKMWSRTWDILLESFISSY
jgi:competence protein ComGC